MKGLILIRLYMDHGFFGNTGRRIKFFSSINPKTHHIRTILTAKRMFSVLFIKGKGHPKRGLALNFTSAFTCSKSTTSRKTLFSKYVSQSSNHFCMVLYIPTECLNCVTIFGASITGIGQ